MEDSYSKYRYYDIIDLAERLDEVHQTLGIFKKSFELKCGFYQHMIKKSIIYEWLLFHYGNKQGFANDLAKIMYRLILEVPFDEIPCHLNNSRELMGDQGEYSPVDFWGRMDIDIPIVAQWRLSLGK